MNTYITNSGIGTEIGEISAVGLAKLVEKTNDIKNKIIVSGVDLKDENISLEDFEKYDEPKTIIAECLNEIAGTEAFDTVEDDDGYNYVLFTDMAPWEYTARERKLKREDVENYLKLLSDVIEDMSIENLYIANYIAD